MSRKRDKLVGVGLGAGLLGAVFLAMKYAIRPPTKERVPDEISPAIFATKVLHTSLGTILYHESGSGETILFIHNTGIGASSYEWSKVYPQFAATHRVLAPDLIGFGESARPGGPMTAAEQARTLAEFLRATCDGPVVIVGSGLGAGFGVMLASQHPELVSRLILLMPTGLAEFGSSRLPLRTRAVSHVPMLNSFLYRNYQATRAAIRASLASDMADPGRLTGEAVEIYTTCAQQAGAEHAIINLEAGRFSLDLESRLKTLSQSVTLLWAEKPHFPPLEWAYRWQAMLPNSWLEILPDCGALAALEVPQTVADALAEQLHTGIRVFQAG